MDGLGLIFMHLQQYSEAIKVYDQLLQIFPKNSVIINKKKLMNDFLLKSA